MIAIIAAMDRNKVIGKSNRLPWAIKEDLTHFKQLTMGHRVVMGRKTFESLGKPLPGRTNIILTHNDSFKVDGCVVAHSISEIMELEKSEDVFVIGGSEVFRQFLPYTDILYFTYIDEAYEGDTWFPEIDLGKWQMVAYEKVSTERGISLSFVTYHRM